jgi:hypothetical protein
VTQTHASPRVQRLMSALREEPDPAHLAAITETMKQCVAAVNDGVGEIAPLLVRLEQLTGKRWEERFFFELWGWTDEADLARAAAVTLPEPVPDWSAAELSEIVRYFTEGPADLRTDRLIDYLEACLPGAFSSDIIYYPHRDMTPEETALEILARRDILARDGKAGLAAHERNLATAVLNDRDAKPYSQMWAKGILRSD